MEKSETRKMFSAAARGNPTNKTIPDSLQEKSRSLDWINSRKSLLNKREFLNCRVMAWRLLYCSNAHAGIERWQLRRI